LVSVLKRFLLFFVCALGLSVLAVEAVEAYHCHHIQVSRQGEIREPRVSVKLDFPQPFPVATVGSRESVADSRWSSFFEAPCIVHVPVIFEVGYSSTDLSPPV
jgi:hypothetical protein